MPNIHKFRPEPWFRLLFGAVSLAIGMLLATSLPLAMGKRELLATFLFRSGMLPGVARWTKAVTVLGYHRIRDDAGSAGGYAFDGEVFGPTQAQFARQMQWLKQNFTVLSEGELLDVLKGPPVRDRFIVVTFDDGYRDNYELAYPVLRAYGAPAVFFVCPGMVDSRTLGWWDLIAFLLKKSKKRTISLDERVFDLERGRESAIGELTTWMKRHPQDKTANLVSRLSEACDVALPSIEEQSRELMTWAQIVELSRNGHAIGSHTHTHRILATLREEDQRWELRESKARLECQLGAPVRTVAYPAGNRSNFTAATMSLAEECGYTAGFSYHSGGNSVGDVRPFDIARIASADSFGPMFVCGALMPQIFTYAHKPANAGAATA